VLEKSGISNAVDVRIIAHWNDGEAFELHDIMRVMDVSGYVESPFVVRSTEGVYRTAERAHFSESYFVKDGKKEKNGMRFTCLIDFQPVNRYWARAGPYSSCLRFSIIYHLC
jgi:hypothetical protein